MPGSNPKRSCSTLIGDYFSNVILYFSLINYDVINNNKGDKHTQTLVLLSNMYNTCTPSSKSIIGHNKIYILGCGECLINTCYYFVLINNTDFFYSK